MSPKTPRVILVTGAARRIGASIARALHAQGDRVVLHCRASRTDADRLAAELNAERADSARILVADLLDVDALPRLAQDAHAAWGRLDGLVNNASSYFATPLSELTPAQFDDLLGTNLRAPLFLSKACAPLLSDGGCIVNIVDTQARRPFAGFSAYLAAKSALWTLTEALALELAPRLRVNGVAPGHMVWADQPQFTPERQAQEVARIPMQRLGGVDEIAHAVRFALSPDAGYMTGAVVPVDGGLRLG